MRTLNIVGCGRVGRTLARVFAQSHAFVVQDLMDVSAAAARAGAAFADVGRAVRRYEQMAPAHVWLITTPDGAIVEACEQLVEAERLGPTSIVVHCSGATPSLDLRRALGDLGHVASFHPVKSFADPGLSAATFAGTWTALEGDRKALRALRPGLRKAGARLFEIDPERKLVYHAASVMVCNYLAALMESGLRCYEAAGIPIETGYGIMEPLVRETLDNVFRSGTARALTGPIARGDHVIVARQIEALAAWDPATAELYRHLGAVALELARRRGGLDARADRALRRLLVSAPRRRPLPAM